MNAISDKLDRSWQLFKRSVLVIRDHPKLLVFPLVTGLLMAGIALFFLAPVALVLLAPHGIAGGRIHAWADSVGLLRVFGRAGLSLGAQPMGALFLAGLYLLDMFVATLGSVAFNSEILEALSGRPVSIRHGIAEACRRWKAVLLWSLFAGFVGLIIRALEERLAFVGRLVAGLIGLAWSVASIFVIPILARDPSFANPVALLSKSATTIKRTWGEMLTGYVGMQGTNALVVWLSLLFWAGTGAAAYLLHNGWLLLVFGIPWLLSVVVYSYLASIASRVYLCALYLHASEGLLCGHYEPAMMEQPWKLKR